VSVFLSSDALRLLPTPEKQKHCKGLYRWTSRVMILSPLAAVALSFGLDRASPFRTLIFLVETFAVWSFAAYWTIKTVEMEESKAEKSTCDANLKGDVVDPTAMTNP
jgi:hypothetical protein